MDVKSTNPVLTEYLKLSLKQKYVISANTGEKSELNKEISSHFKLSTTDKEEGEDSKIFSDSTYRMLTARIKSAKISNLEKKRILRMIIDFFKNQPDEKKKMKIANLVNSMVAVKENADQNAQYKNSAASRSVYGHQSLNDFVDALEKNAINQIKANRELQQITENAIQT